MIYLIGGAPRVGKSIIGKKLANIVGATFVSTDELDESLSTLSSILKYLMRILRIMDTLILHEYIHLSMQQVMSTVLVVIRN